MAASYLCLAEACCGAERGRARYPCPKKWIYTLISCHYTKKAGDELLSRSIVGYIREGSRFHTSLLHPADLPRVPPHARVGDNRRSMLHRKLSVLLNQETLESGGGGRQAAIAGEVAGTIFLRPP